MHGNILFIIGLSIIVATALAYVARATKQPLLLAYIAAGLLLGPHGFGWIAQYDQIATLSELGLAFLLFIVGLEIDIRKLVKLGRVSLLTGVIQLFASAALGMWFAGVLGFHRLPALYLGIALAFSSTMVVVKLLSDKSELDTIHGRLTLSILLIQDIFAIVVLALQTNLTDPSLGSIARSLLYGIGLTGGTVLTARYVLPIVFRFAAKSPELILISSLSWCFLVCGAAVAAHFSIAMGALIAGISISSFPYTLDVAAKIRSLRDFFVTLFFVSLGMQLNLTSPSILGVGIMLALLIIVTRWITVFPTLYLQQFGTRVGILTSMNLAQASEFSLVIAAVGFSLGHISQEIVSLIALALIITSTVSTYLIDANHAVTKPLVRLLSKVGLEDQNHYEETERDKGRYDIIFLGCHRIAGSALPVLMQENIRFLVVDFNPEVLEKLKKNNISCTYADLSHTEALEHIGLEDARVIISSISDDFLRGTTNLSLVRFVSNINPHACIISTADSSSQALEQYEAGAHYVLLPRHVTAQRLSFLLVEALDGTLKDLTSSNVTSVRNRVDII